MFKNRLLFYSFEMGLRETFRENLIYYRKKAGYTQEELSEKSNCNLNYIATIECASSRFPRPETIDAIAEALNIPTSALFMEKGSPKNLATFDSEKFTNQVITQLSQQLSKEMLDYLEKNL